MDKLWTDLLTFINQLVSPDWGALVALVPISLVLLVVAYVAWLIVRYANAGPTRRGKRRLPPKPPPGVHAAETSWAPVLGAIGSFALLAGFVFKGWVFIAGVVVLILTLLFWLREAMRDYDHVDHPVTALVPVTTAGPPPGIHVPGPSFRPILASIAMAALLFGFVFGGYLLIAGAIMLAIALLQWLVDARREYRGVVISDVTGHLPADPRPNYPRGTLAAFAVVFAGAVVLQAGILPPKTTVGGTGASGAPPSGAPGPSGSPGASGGPGGSVQADVHVTALNLAFEQAPANAPASKNFTLAFDNRDPGIPHNVDIQGPSGTSVFKGEIVTGPILTVYNVPALQPGTYKFICDVHPTTMTGTLVVQ
jgi:plastocyanin